MEDGCLKGGLFGAVAEYMAEHGHLIDIKGFGIPDMFMEQASQKAQREMCGLDEESVENFLQNFLANHK